MKAIIRKEIHLLPATFKALEKEAKGRGSNLKNHIELILNQHVEEKCNGILTQTKLHKL